jgi:hypothetical protein
MIRAMAQVPDAAVAALLSSVAAFEAVWTGFEDLPFAWALVPVKSWIRGIKAMNRSIDARAELWKELGWSPAEARLRTLGPIWDQASKQSPFMATVLEGVGMTLGGMPKPPQQMLAMARTTAGRGTLVGLRDGACTEMLLRHAMSEDFWPQGGVRDRALAIGVPAAVLEEVRVPAEFGHRDDVYNAPGVAAAISVLDKACPLPLLLEIRRIRSFDETWFDFAHAMALTLLLGKRFAENKELFDAV